MQATYFLKIEGTGSGNGAIPIISSWDAKLPYPCDGGALSVETRRRADEIGLGPGWSLVFLQKM